MAPAASGGRRASLLVAVLVSVRGAAAQSLLCPQQTADWVQLPRIVPGSGGGCAELFGAAGAGAPGNADAAGLCSVLALALGDNCIGSNAIVGAANDYWAGKLSCTQTTDNCVDTADPNVGSGATQPWSAAVAAGAAGSCYKVEVHGLCLDGSIPAGDESNPGITWMSRMSGFNIQDPGQYLGPLPSAAWSKLGNIQDFEISRETAMGCAADGSTAVLVDGEEGTNDVHEVLDQVRSLKHVDDSSVKTGITLKNLCITGFFHESTGLNVHFSHFKKLDLSGNAIRGTLELGDAEDWASLEELALANNRLEGELPSILDNLPMLRRLDVSGNAFTGAILNEWSAGCVLRELDLTDNNMDGTWPENLAQCGSLQTLKLSNNALSGAISAGFFDNLGLRAVHIDNQIGKGGGLTGPLPVGLFEMQRPFGTLEELKLNDNLFTGSLPAVQTAMAGGCVSMYCPAEVPSGPIGDGEAAGCVTQQAYQQQSGTGFHAVEECTLVLVNPAPGSADELSVNGKNTYDNPLQKLQVLQVHNNQLDGPIPDLSPYCVDRSSGGLTELTFHKNDFSGRLPQSYAFCKGLQELRLEHLPLLEGPLPRIEPALRACGACAAHLSEGQGGGCPAGTIEQEFGQEPPYASVLGDLGDWPGVDQNGAALRPDGNAKGSSCCRWYKCFSGSYMYNVNIDAMVPLYSRYPLATEVGLLGEGATEDCPNLCTADLNEAAPEVPVGAVHQQVVQGATARCKVLMNEYEYFSPPHWEQPLNDFCDLGHLPMSYEADEAAGGSNLATLRIDGAFMGSMSGPLPQLDNNPQVHTIDVKNARWLQRMPALQTQAHGCSDPATCAWNPLYPSLSSLTITDSITPQTDDGLTYAVHPQLHLGDLHGHYMLETVDLRSNNLKGDLPNVDDPVDDLFDHLRTLDVSSNKFGRGDCIDCSAGQEDGCTPDCVPVQFQYLYMLSDLRLHDNEMNGAVPDVFFKLPHLRSLLLSHNDYASWNQACGNAAECSCTAGGRLFDMYHRAEHDGTRVPAVGQLASSNLQLDVRYNQLTSLPLHQLRLFAGIDASNNLIDADGLKANHLGNLVGVFSALAGDCAAYTYPSLRSLDLSGNNFGDCSSASNQPACTAELETMVIDTFAQFVMIRTIDLSGSNFSPKIDFPQEWIFSNSWPNIVNLKLGGVFVGTMPFGSLGDCPEGLVNLHLMNGELRSEVMLGPVDADDIQSKLSAKFAPYEISYTNRRVDVIPAASADGFAYTKVSFTVLKGASWASTDGPSPGVQAVTAARLALDLGITKMQELDPDATICANCGRCRSSADPLEYCNDLGNPMDDCDPAGAECDYEIRAAQASGLELPSSLLTVPDSEGATAQLLKSLSESAAPDYAKMSVLYDYTVRHLGCPGEGCDSAQCITDPSCQWEGDYRVEFKLVEAEARAPPFFTCANLVQLEIQNNQFGGELRNVYNHLDYSTVSLNGGMPAKYFNATPMARADALYFGANRFTGSIPAILPRHKLVTVDPCGMSSPLTGAVMMPPDCTPPENFMYQLQFAEPGPSDVSFCTRDPATGLVDCGGNVFDCPIPTIPQAFYVRNVKNDPAHGFCGCDECSQYDDSGQLLRTCRPVCDDGSVPSPAFGEPSSSMCDDGRRSRPCECNAQPCECVSGQRTLLRDSDGQVTGLGEPCEINPYTDCSARVSKFSYTHWIYDSADCSCPTGHDCANSMSMDSADERSADACRPFCSACQPGQFASETNSLSCELCSAGHYSSQYGQTACDACKRGKYTEGGGAAGGGACKLCEVGTYGVREGAGSCEPAPRGTFVNFEGAYCLDPPDRIPGVWSGTTCDMINATEQPVGPRHCNGGLHAADPGSTACAECEPGRFSLPGGMYTECTPCPAGTMTDPSTSASALLCMSCEIGQYQPEVGQQECVPAPKGSMASAIGLDTAQPCTGNTVAPYEGLTECEECPPKLRPDALHETCVPCSAFGSDEGCEVDSMTVLGLGGAAAVGVIILVLYCYKLAQDSSRSKTRSEIKDARLRGSG